MSRNISNLLFQAEVVKDEQDVILHLVTITVPYYSSEYPEATIHLSDGAEDAILGGITYIAFPLQFGGGFSQTSDGSIDKATLTLANPERALMSYVENYNNLQGTTVEVKTMYQKFLATQPTAYVVDYFIVDSYAATDTVLTLNLDPSINFERKLPRGSFYSNNCRFLYKDPLTCKYSGPLTSCKKNFEDCANHTVQVATGTTVVSVVNNVYLATSNNMPSSVTPGWTLQLNGKNYFVSSSKATSDGRIAFLGDNTVSIGTNNFVLLAGNTKNFGGFPGVPSSSRRLVL